MLFYVQQRFEEMEAKINDLRDQIETIKAEKHRLEKQIQVESEVCLFLFLFIFLNPTIRFFSRYFFPLFAFRSRLKKNKIFHFAGVTGTTQRQRSTNRIFRNRKEYDEGRIAR